MVPSWATLVEEEPNPAVVTDATLRAAIIASGLAWRVRDTATQIEMLLIPAGTFTMGCRAPNQWGYYGDENPTRSVTLTQSFYMGRYEVTQSQWVAKMSSNPSRFQAYSDSARRPVESVSWNAIQGFLSETDMRLPSQAEWQYACWAVTTTALNNGSSDDATVGNVAWHWENSGFQTHAVGGKAANALGLHDMLGNVWEWGNDWRDEIFCSLSPPTEWHAPVPTRVRVTLGDSFFSEADEVRSSLRKAIYTRPDSEDDDLGFRVARNP
jgi:formylglycine-generating enzyme required for sulfatase activity